MKRILIAFFLLNGFDTFSQQNNYEQAWQNLNTNNRVEAARLLTEAEKDPATFNDAFISKLYLKSYNGKQAEITDFGTSFYSKSENPYPYIFALWFNSAVIGQPGKKYYNHQVQLVDQLISDEKAPGTLVGSANYQKGMHYLFSNEFDKIQRYFDAVGNIRNWQYTGPFENLSESGFYKNYGPLEHSEPTATFRSLTNADVKWITPSDELKDGWTPVCYQFNNQTAVVYAQNFVNSAIGQTVYCNVGVTGSIKVWINDELIISESKERVTDMDTYTVKYDLKKGANRVLVQLGYTASSYPNFNLRFTDEKYKSLTNITGSSVYTSYPKVAGSEKKFDLVPHFAEAFFADKIARQPGNLVNYLLLADVYMRSIKVIEARKILTEAIKKAPDNCLLKMKMAEVLVKENNRTLLLEELDKIKQADPNSLIVFDLKLQELFNNQKYEDGAVELQKRIELYGEDENTAAYRILLLVHDKKYEELVKEAERLYNRYPENAKLLEMMYVMKKEVYKDSKEAIKLYENYMKNNYSYTVFEKYASILEEQGNSDKALDVKKKLTELFPYSPSGYHSLSKYYFTTKDYKRAEAYILKALALSPYNENYWEQMGDIKNEQKNTNDAMDAYNRSLKYDPNQYTIISKIRKLNGKTELNKVFKEMDIVKTINEDKQSEAKNTDYGYYYILDQKNVIIYADGASEEYYTTLIRITNQKGVDNYKESSISYNNSQSLLIEKAEIFKSSGSKIEGERNGNEIVFTNLEPGDVIVFKYRIQSYAYGRFAKEFWDHYYFGGQIYTATTRYNLLAPATQKINYVMNNFSMQPLITNVEDFKQYTWEMLKPEPLKNEPLMPVLVDICPVLHISTVSSWNEISDWYSDICNNKAEEDFEIVDLYKNLFPDGQKQMTQFQKARIIYDYIESNISYSSVSFRQSSYVPQRPSATLTTRLGDCKDLSSLFVTLAHKAGINAQMVLVNTKDNGEKEMALPSVEFNHCIAKAILDNKEYYIELTDNYLPFASLPNNIVGAAILEIPGKGITAKPQIQLLKSNTRTRDVIKRFIDIKPVGSDLNIMVKTIKCGHPSSNIRYSYGSFDNEKQLLDIEKTVASGYKNTVKMDKVGFDDLDKLSDSVVYTYSYKVKNEVSEIGTIQTFKIIYPDLVASLDNFSSDSRTYPFQYMNYEDIDEYETIVNISAPIGKKFIEVPASENISLKDMRFSIHYALKTPHNLIITRKFSSNRQNIPAAEYTLLKDFMEKIVKAEQKFIAYK